MCLCFNNVFGYMGRGVKEQEETNRGIEEMRRIERETYREWDHCQ